ncbi:MAG TPA: PspC domain-containing protein, partial [Gaiellaceae bacterium]|nr:PspC domain-containing protein [Gaiellaceae bacterium]
PGAPTQPLAAAAPPEPRRLRRSRRDRVLAGVCGGVAEYFRVDPVLIRIAAVVLVFAGGAGLLLYLIGWIVMPEDEPSPAPAPATTAGLEDEEARSRGAVALGLLFVVLGALFLVDEVWPDLVSWKYLWPIALIAVGVAILLRARR